MKSLGIYVAMHINTCGTKSKLLITHMNANIQLVMNSFETLFHDEDFLPDNSRTVKKNP